MQTVLLVYGMLIKNNGYPKKIQEPKVILKKRKDKLVIVLRELFNWGIGRELYTSPFIWVNAKDCNLYSVKANGKEMD